MPDLVIRNARLLIDHAIQPAEIAVDNGKITKVGKIIRYQDVNEVIDAKGALVLPGAIDVHVHFRDPGMTKKENWYSGSCAAAGGGVTTVIDHPNTIPPTVDPLSFKEKKKEARKSIVDYGINAGVTSKNTGSLKELWELGVTAFGEIFMAESTGALNINDRTLKETLRIIGDLGGIACIHAEDEETRTKYVRILKGNLAPESYSKSRPNLSEKIAVEKAIKLSSDTKLHLCHISAQESLEAIRKAKAEKKGLTCEVTPHHLFLSSHDYRRLGTLGKMNPPLRDTFSQQSLWKGLNDGTIDIVSSDHAPHLESEKMTDIWTCPAGVPGVETMMPLMLMAVRRNLLTLNRLIEILCQNPARIFNLNKGIIAKGYDADMIIVGEQKEIRREKMHSKAGWTPFSGMQGIFPEKTILRGAVIFEDGEIVASRGHGSFIHGPGYVSSHDTDE